MNFIERKDDEPASSLQSTAHKSATGAVWLLAGRMIGRVLDLMVLLLLARVLEPADFGKVALAMTVLYVVEAVLEIPLMPAMIRAPSIEKSHLDTAFTLGLLRGLFITVIMCAAAWPYAAFNNDPSLAVLICVLSLAPALRSLASPAMVHFARNINFRPEFLLDVISKLVSLIAGATVALTLHNYWALAAATIAGPAAIMTTSYILAPYRPRLSLKEWSTFNNLVLWTTIGQFLNAFSWQIDRILLGRNTSRDQLGHYAVAGDLANLPYLALITPLWRTLVAGFSTIQSDAQRLGSAYLRAISAVFTIGAPALLGLAFLAAPLVRILLGDKWDDSVALVAAFGVINVISLYTVPLTLLVMVLNRSQINVKMSLIVLAFKLPLMLLGLTYFGIPGVVAAALASCVLYAGLALYNGTKVAPVTMSAQLLSPWRPLLSCAGMGAFVVPAGQGLMSLEMGPVFVIALGATIGVGAVSYAMILFGLWHLSGRPAGTEALIWDRAKDIIVRLKRRSQSRD